MELYFYPEKTEEATKAFARGNTEESRLLKLTEILQHLKGDVEKRGLPKWEITHKGYIEVSSGGLLPVEKMDLKPR